jgi:endonuclease/exonuclease/phosphatase family metal-dependent hydrolase
MSVEPDVISYNEVPFRMDEFLAPEGYSLYRDMSNRFTAATPVAWRTDRWTAIDNGTRWISNWRGRPPGKEVELGRRTANWVTLQGVDGRVISVISVHVAPPTRGMPDLLKKSIRSLNGLVEELAPRGPVLVGGDFNVHYTSGRYPRTMLASSQLVPTYDTIGAWFPTGDHFGNTIDYLFARGEDQLVATSQYPMEMKSDHDAVVGEYTWLVDAPATITTVRNNPQGTNGEQRAVVKTLLDAVNAAEPGTTVALRTGDLQLRGLVRALRRALERGAHVQVMTANDAPTRLERVLTRAVVAQGDVESWVQACGSACLATWRDAGMPRALLMVGSPTGAWTARYDTSRVLGELVTQQSRVTVQVGRIALDEGAALLATTATPPA